MLATSPSTSATLHNLPTGSEHTVNVLARDADGRLSHPSELLTFDTTAPRDSNCLVNYRLDSSWGNGFVATVTVSNVGDAPVNGWTLDFTWPSTGQSVQSSWKANITGSGTRVHVTDNGTNAELAPRGGSTATFGFVGANDGANPAPTAFTLNGTIGRASYPSACGPGRRRTGGSSPAPRRRRAAILPVCPRVETPPPLNVTVLTTPNASNSHGRHDRRFG